MRTPTTRCRVPLLAWGPISAAIVAESASNVLRGYGIGSNLAAYTVTAGPYTVSLTGVTLGLAAVALAIYQTKSATVALLPIAPVRQRLLAGVLAALLLAVSAGAWSSHILEAQRAKAGGESSERTAWALAKAAYDKAKAESDRLGTGSTTDEVRRAMDKVRVAPWAWTETRQCTSDASAMSAEAARACKPMLDLRVAMAQAIARAEAKRELAAAGAKLATLKPQPEATADETMLARGWAWLMGAAVVLAATFGPALFAQVEQVPVRRTDGHGTAAAGQSAIAAETTPEADGSPDRPEHAVSGPDHGGGSGGPGGVRPDKQAVLNALLTDLALGRRFGSQDELAQRFGRRKSTISDWLREWEEAGLIPVRQTRGRCKVIEVA